jgi:hypothetical protein
METKTKSQAGKTYLQPGHAAARPRLGRTGRTRRPRPGSPQGSRPERTPRLTARSLSQLTPKGLSPAHGLDSFSPRLVPLTDSLAKLQLPQPHLLGLGSHLLPGRQSLHSCRHCLRLQLIAEQPKVRHLGALLGEALIGLGKHDSLGPQRILDVALTVEEQRLGGAHVRKFLRKENRTLQRMPWSRKVYI